MRYSGIYFGIGKAAALRVLASGGHALTYVGDTSRILSEITAQATPFILACYGQTKCMSLTGARQKMWANKVSQSVAGAQKLASLPPTNEAFNENVARTHLQVSVWRNALQPDPPAIDPTAFGWSLEEAHKTLIPTTLPSDTPLVPDDELLKLVRCSCRSETPCETERCGCSSASLACSVSCACQGGQCCFNERTRQALQTDDYAKMNRCVSIEPGMGSKQPVWKLFNMVIMTTINLKAIAPLFLNLF